MWLGTDAMATKDTQRRLIKDKAILHGQNDMERGDLDLLSLLVIVNATGVHISQIMQSLKGLNQAHIFLKEYMK